MAPLQLRHTRQTFCIRRRRVCMCSCSWEVGHIGLLLSNIWWGSDRHRQPYQHPRCTASATPHGSPGQSCYRRKDGNGKGRRRENQRVPIDSGETEPEEKVVVWRTLSFFIYPAGLTTSSRVIRAIFNRQRWANFWGKYSDPA